MGFQIIGFISVFLIFTLSTSRGALPIDLSDESTSVRLEDFPYIVSLRSNGKHFCTGAILEENWVLTAAKCVHKVNSQDLTVEAGIISLNEENQKRGVKEVLIHENFKLPFENDVALLQLSTPFNFDKTVSIVHLEKNKSPSGTQVYALGWNLTSRAEEDHLLKLHLNVVSDENCKNRVHKPQPKEKICVKEYSDKGCLNDIGGPLVDAALSAQLGIASEPSCKFEYPQVYTQISFYLDWIQTNSNNSASLVEKIKNKIFFELYEKGDGFSSKESKEYTNKNLHSSNEMKEAQIEKYVHDRIKRETSDSIAARAFGKGKGNGKGASSEESDSVEENVSMEEKDGMGDKGGMWNKGSKGEIGGIVDKEGIGDKGDTGGIGGIGGKGGTKANCTGGGAGNKGEIGGIGNKGDKGGIGGIDSPK